MSRGDIAIRRAREAVDRELASAARALESAATSLQELQDHGINYAIPGSGDALTFVRTLSRSALELQIEVRKANHGA